VGCEGKRSLLLVFEELAAMMDLRLSDAQQKLSPQDKANIYLTMLHDHCEVGRARILALLEQQEDWHTPKHDRARDIAPRMLVVLDNVDQSNLLAGTELGALPKSDWLDFIVTTRLGPHELGLPADHAIEIGNLPPEDALELLRALHSFADDGEETAARDLVRMLGGHVLSVELAGAHVKDQAAANYSYAALHDYLSAQGVDALEQVPTSTSAKTRAAITAKTIGLIIGQTWPQLSAAEQRMLEYASLCPPELVPTDWLRNVVAQEFAELEPSEGPSLMADPWSALLAKLNGRRLLPVMSS